MRCPNKNTPQWKALVEKIGENNAWREFLKYGDIPSSDDYEQTGDSSPVFRSIRTSAPEEIAKKLDTNLVRSEDDIKYTRYIQSAVSELLGDVAPGKELTMTPGEAFNRIKKRYSQRLDDLNILSNVIKSQDVLNAQRGLNTWSVLLEQYPVLHSVEKFEDIEKLKKVYSDLANNFSRYENFVVAGLAKKGIRISTSKKNVEAVDPQEIVDTRTDATEDNSEISQHEIGARYDATRFETNVRDTASSRVKLILETIKTGQVEAGIPVYAESNEVFADILYIGSRMPLTGYTESFTKYHAFMTRLQERATFRPYLKDLEYKIQKFAEAGEFDKINDILKVATKEFGDETILLWLPQKVGNEIVAIGTSKLINNNRETAEDQVAAEWLAAHQTSSFFKTDGQGDLYPDLKKVEKLNDLILQGRTAGLKRGEYFKKFFETLGIQFTDSDIEAISKSLGERLGKGSKSFPSVFNANNMLEHIYKSFKDNVDVPFKGQYGIPDESTSMYALAGVYYDANPGRFTNASARTADGKSKYLFHEPTYIANKKRQWMNGQYSALLNSAFAKPNADFWNEVKNGQSTFSMGDYNGMIEEKSARAGKVRKEFTEKEQLVNMFLMHQADLSLGSYITFTLSDKTTSAQTKIKKEFFRNTADSPMGHEVEYNVSGNSIVYTDNMRERIYRNIVAPEVSRIQAAIQAGNQPVENFSLATKLFYVIPALNSLESLQTFRDTVYSGGNVSRQIQLEVGETILSLLDSNNSTLLSKYRDNGIIKVNPKTATYSFPTFDKRYVARMKKTKAKNDVLARLMIMDMNLNYINAQVKTLQFLRFDPAVAFKMLKDLKGKEFSEIEGRDKERLVNSTWDEFSKRAAALIAPGGQGSWTWNYGTADAQKTYSSTSYNAVTVADVSVDGSDIADAQEFVTMQEHIDYLMSEGKIPVKVWETIYKKIQKAGPGGYYELSPKELKYVFTPIKPVQVNDVDLGNTGLNRIDYVKSSRFPLIPQHEVGSARDDLRKWMEKNDIRSANFASAKKLGRPVKSVELFSKDGTEFITPSETDMQAATQVLFRDGLRTQQEIPHQHAHVRTVTQMNRTLLDGLLNDTFSIGNISSIKGGDMKSLKESVRSRMFEIENEKLQKRLGDLSKSHKGLHDVIKDIIMNDTSGSYGENDLRAIELGPDEKFLYPLEFQGKVKKFQGLVNSMINKNVMLEVDGASFVQVSGIGAKYKLSDLSNGIKSDIIWVNHPRDEFKLKYISKKDGVVSPAQVIVSQYIRDNKGNIVDLNDYITEENGIKVIDKSKFTPEMFQLIGTRIPNQSLVSTLPIEVAGFLPSYIENSIVVPDGITGQMGSDFDVDKLYTYISKMVEVDGVYSPVSYELNSPEDISGFSKEQLQQLYRDIHWSVLTSSGAYDAITKSVDLPEVKAKISERENALKKYSIAEDTGVNLPLSFSTSVNRYNDNRSGKDGVAVFANLISAQADFQDKILQLGTIIEGNTVLDPVEIYANGKKLVLGYLGQVGKSVSFLNETRSISDNLNIGFSESVDNAKNLNLRKFNWDKKAMAPIGVFNMLSDKDGNAAPIEFSMDLTSQNIIYELFTLTDQKQDSFGEFDPDAANSAARDLYKKYISQLQEVLPAGQIAADIFLDPARDNVLSTRSLKLMWLVGQAVKVKNTEALQNIALETKYDNIDSLLAHYYLTQLDALMLFEKLDGISREMMSILGGVYVYTKGVGADVFNTMQKIGQLNKLSQSNHFLGIENIAGIVEHYDNGTFDINPKGEIGSAIKNSYKVAQDIYGKIFPISSGNTVRDLVGSLLGGVGSSREELGKQRFIDIYNSVFGAIKGYVYTMPELELFDNVRETREQLINGKSSLGYRITELKKDPTNNSNGFLKNIMVKKEYNRDVYTIAFKSPFGTDLDESVIMSGFYELALSEKPELRQLAKDIALYPYATADAGNFLRFIPVDYYQSDDDFRKAISTISSAYTYQLYDSPDRINALKDQIVQNNPEQFSKKLNFATRITDDRKAESVFKKILGRVIGKTETDADTSLIDTKRFTIRISDIDPTPENIGVINSLSVRLSREDIAMAKKMGLLELPKAKYPDYLYVTDAVVNEVNPESGRVAKYLYKRTSSVFTPNHSATYERINVLGFRNIAEYSYTEDELKSAIKDNNIDDEIDTDTPFAPDDVDTTTTVEPTPDPVQQDSTPTFINPMALINQAEHEEIVNMLLEQTIDENLIKTLQNMYKMTDNQLHKQIIQSLIRSGNLEEMKITLALFGDIKSPGEYFPAEKKAVINPDLVFDDKNASATEMRDRLNEVILHELLHHVTIDLLKSSPENLSTDQKKWVKALKNTYEYAREKISKDPKHSEQFKRALAQVEAEDGYLSVSEKSMYYGLTSVYEFITMLMTDRGFQELMNNTVYDGKKSLMERFIEIISNILKSLGLEINDNSVLKEGMTNIVSLLHVRNEEADFETESHRSIKTTVESRIDQLTEQYNISKICK